MVKNEKQKQHIVNFKFCSISILAEPGALTVWSHVVEKITNTYT